MPVDRGGCCIGEGKGSLVAGVCLNAMTYESIKNGRGYWLLVSHDLSLRSNAKSKQAQEFKRSLVADGFDAIQPSLYARFCASAEVCETHQTRVCKIAPEFSKLTFVRLTDLQFQGVFRNGKHAINPLPASPKLITIV